MIIYDPRKCGSTLPPFGTGWCWCGSFDPIFFFEFGVRKNLSAHSWSCWNEACSNWCLIERLFRANTTSCVRAGVLPGVPVLEVCFEHTWFKLLHGIAKTRFRANTTRRVRAKRCPETFLARANRAHSKPFLADFGICCSARLLVSFDWFPTWHFKAIAHEIYFAKLRPRPV